jgi:acyl transferase domain-containing protein
MLYHSRADEQLVHQTAYTQPAMFALEYALYRAWDRWGLKPAALLGHSIGEYVAACIAGALSLEDALTLVAARGALMQSLPTDGAMLVAFAPVDRVGPLLEGAQAVDIAASNSPRNTVLSGDARALSELASRLEREGISTRPVKTSHAFHSPLVEPILDDFERVAARVRFNPIVVPIASNVTGEMLEPGFVYDAAYWRRHLRGQVRFLDGLRALAAAGCALFLEAGPTPTLVQLGREAIPELTWACALDRRRDDWEAILDAVAALQVAGLNLNWDAFDRPYAARKADAPKYPLQRASYWLPFKRARSSKPATAGHPLLSRRK